MYSIHIHDKTFTVLTKLFTPNVFDIQYTNELNKPGSAVFKIRVLDPAANVTNLRVLNRIKIYNDSNGEFIGFIESIRVVLNVIEVRCIGILGLFDKRIVTSTLQAVDAALSMQNLLNGTNALDDTFIDFGSSDVVYTINKIDFSRSTLNSAFTKIANTANNSEFEITIDQVLNFKQKLGTDKSSTLILQYISTQIDSANLLDFDVEITSKDMYNKVIGVGDNNLTSTQQDNTAISSFGLLETPQNFAQTNSQTDLDNETLNFVNSHKVEFYIPQVQVDVDKLPPSNFVIGDIVKVVLQYGFVVVSQNYRITKKTVKFSNNGKPQLTLNISPEGTNLLPSSFFNDIVSLGNRIGLLEGTL